MEILFIGVVLVTGVLSILFIADEYNSIKPKIILPFIFAVTLTWLIVAECYRPSTKYTVPVINTPDGIQFISLKKYFNGSVININSRFGRAFTEKEIQVEFSEESWSCGIYLMLPGNLRLVDQLEAK